MASEADVEPMDQDCDDGDDTLQVQVTNDLFGNNNETDDLLDFEEADDLEVAEFSKRAIKKGVPVEKHKRDEEKTGSTKERITISVVGDDNMEDTAKEDGEISETQSQSDDEKSDDGNGGYLSRSSSMRSSRKRNDIRRERSPIARRYPNPYLEFDDEKIQSRALRFGLTNSTTPSGTSQPDKPAQLADEDLLNLYISCRLIQDDGGELTLEKVASHHRLDSILIRGTNHMNTNEIFKYLYDLGQKPVAMEWVNDAMCVVIFDNKYDAATSMIKTSKPILMDPGLAERKRSMVETSSSDANKEKDETNEEKKDAMSEDFDFDKAEAIPQSWITVPMPPGYVWRLGTPCEKARGILVRYATKHDKKQERAERFSEFYKNYGNPNKSGGREDSRGENVHRRKKIRHQNSLSESDRKDQAVARESQLKMLNPNDKNGWGQLSAMWDDEEAFQNSARDRFTFTKQRSKDSDSSHSGVSPLKKQDSSKETTIPKAVDARDILKTRQKRKRGTYSSDEEESSDVEDNFNRADVNDSKDKGSFRRKGSKVEDDDDDGDNIAWRERLSAPRMRMHADEEEERQKRRAFRRLGRKKAGESSLQTNSWDFSRDSSNNSSFRSKTQNRRPISERLGAKRIPQKSANDNPRDENASFDLRHKLINMRKAGNDDDGNTDDEEDLQNLIFYSKD
ncbi:unnamed protein product [Orchesella dallaii]|uniref:Nuclear cap-binding protein subunit 3 n=1 Tax=Orchesella dallaii TaxID=48710 RepID=A0ABP1PZN5_9HEXA